jgi:hypothetical protein
MFPCVRRDAARFSRSVCLSVCLYVCLSVCLSVCLLLDMLLVVGLSVLSIYSTVVGSQNRQQRDLLSVRVHLVQHGNVSLTTKPIHAEWFGCKLS